MAIQQPGTSKAKPQGRPDPKPHPQPSFEWQGGISGGSRVESPHDDNPVKMQDAGPEDDNNP